MIKIYFSAKWLFDELDKKLAATGAKMSLREMQNVTGVNRAILRKLRDENCQHVSSETLENLYRYAVGAGMKVRPDSIVRFVVVESE